TATVRSVSSVGWQSGWNRSKDVAHSPVASVVVGRSYPTHRADSNESPFQTDRSNRLPATSPAIAARMGGSDAKSPPVATGGLSAKKKPGFQGRSRASGTSLDEEHLAVGRQRPQVVGDERLQLVAVGPQVGHLRDDRVAHVLGVGERVALRVV